MNQIPYQLLRWAEAHPLWVSASIHGLALAGALAIWAGPREALLGRSGETLIQLAERESTWAEPIPPRLPQVAVDEEFDEPQLVEAQLAGPIAEPDPIIDRLVEAFTPWGGPGADRRARALKGQSTHPAEVEVEHAEAPSDPLTPSPDVVDEASEQTPTEEQTAAVEAPVRIEGSDPVYPLLSIRFGEEGDVLCKLTLNSHGQVIGVDIRQSSGHARLDAAAREALLTWRFVLAQGRDTGIQSLPTELDHVVHFRLSDA